jgi:hypothetical protein
MVSRSYPALGPVRPPPLFPSVPSLIFRVSYVPVSTDFEDLWAIQAFFVGDEKGRGAHDEMAKEIAMAGKKWAANNWRWSDMEVCTSLSLSSGGYRTDEGLGIDLYRLLLEVSSSPFCWEMRGN